MVVFGNGVSLVLFVYVRIRKTPVSEVEVAFYSGLYFLLKTEDPVKYRALCEMHV